MYEIPPRAVAKTLTAMQLMAAMALKFDWFGEPVMAGGALLYTAEDEPDELHRRFAAIVAQSGIGSLIWTG